MLTFFFLYEYIVKLIRDCVIYIFTHTIINSHSIYNNVNPYASFTLLNRINITSTTQKSPIITKGIA